MLQRTTQHERKRRLFSFVAVSTTILARVHSFGDLWPGRNPPKSLGIPSNLLQGTNIDPSKPNVDLQCVYKASRDGWSAIDFHDKVDSQGSALVVCLSRSGKTFGGYCPTGWMSTDDYVSSNAAFLWCSSGNNNNNQAIRFPVLKGGNAAVFDYASAGPMFGAADLKIGESQSAIMGGFAGPDTEDRSTGAGNLQTGTSNIGGAYEDSSNRWPVRGDFRLVELEVYTNANIVVSSSSDSGFKLWPF